MQNAETVLDVLRERGRRGLPLNKLYRLLFNPQLYLLAYGRIYSNKGAMTPGTDAETADGMTMGKIERIIDALRHERYRFKPVKRHYIPKKDGKQRPLGLPSWSDKLLGEIVRLLLEAYYEPQFSEHSHGYRPGRGCHTALRDVAVGWTATTWFIEGDISRCFDELDHSVTLQTLGEKIDDNRFLRLIGQMLQPGIWRTGCGTPGSAARRRGGFSPRACPTSTSTGWTSSSKQFCCRNTPEVCTGVPILSTSGSQARSGVLANAATMPLRERCRSSNVASLQRIYRIPSIGGCVTSGMRIYADIGINRLMPSSELCRVTASSRAFAAAKREIVLLVARHNPGRSWTATVCRGSGRTGRPSSCRGARERMVRAETLVA